MFVCVAVLCLEDGYLLVYLDLKRKVKKEEKGEDVEGKESKRKGKWVL